jgi:hypothetical protein
MNTVRPSDAVQWAWARHGAEFQISDSGSSQFDSLISTGTSALHPLVAGRFTALQSTEETSELPPASTRLQQAEDETRSFQTTEIDLPETTAGILLLFTGLVVVAGLTIRTSLRDSRFLRRGPRIMLLVPRLIVLLLLLVVLLNPQSVLSSTRRCRWHGRPEIRQRHQVVRCPRSRVRRL